MNPRIGALGVVAIAVAVVAFAGTHSAPGHAEAVDPGAMNLTVKFGGIGGACDDTKCFVVVGSDFTLAVEVTKAPVTGYVGFRTEVNVDGLIYNPKPSVTDELVWQDGASNFSRSVLGSLINHGGTTAVGPPGPLSFFEGNILELNMACPVAKGNHTVDLVPLDAGNADGSSFRLSFFSDATVAPDSLDINCIDPTIGGVAELPDADTASLTATDSSGFSTVVLAWVLAGTAAVIVLGSGAFLVRRRQADRG